MRTTLITLMIIALPIFHLSAQMSPDELVTPFFNSINQGEISKAIRELPKSQSLTNDTVQINRAIARLQTAEENAGDYLGFELIEVQEISDSYLIQSYLIKYTDVPLRINFVVYRPLKLWQVNSISFQQLPEDNRPVRNARRRF